jgi:hypothetical protein
MSALPQQTNINFLQPLFLQSGGNPTFTSLSTLGALVGTTQVANKYGIVSIAGSNTSVANTNITSNANIILTEKDVPSAGIPPYVVLNPGTGFSIVTPNYGASGSMAYYIVNY